VSKAISCCLVGLILTLFCLIFPRVVAASSLSWTLVYPSQRESTAIKISPSDPNLVYASIRLSNDFNLLKSTDKGIDWTSIKNGLPAGLDVNWISLTSSKAGTIAISLWGNGINLSEDYGTTWTNIYLSPPSRSVEISPTNPNTIFVGIGGNHDSNSGVYKTIDKGSNWTKTSLTNNNAQIIIDNSYPNRIFADSDPGYFRSLDGGNSWIQLPISYTFSNTIIDNLNANTIYTSQFDSGNGIYKSIDNGDSWLRKSNTIASSAFRFAQDTDGTLYATRYYSGGGLWRSIDRAETWENIADPAWATASGNTWGLDARNGRIIVSVEGLGIYIANTDGSPINPPPPPPTHKICVSNACTVIAGAESDSCQANTDCQPPPPPVCDSLSVNPASGDAPLTSRINISGHSVASGSYINTYRLDFGDGATSERPSNTYFHTYLSAGTFTVKGYVIDNFGSISLENPSCQGIVTANNPGPSPVVVIPGFGGSWSYKGLVLQQPTTYSDWELFPKFSDYYYQPLINTLLAAGLSPNDKLFIFAYDWRKSLWESASWLNTFLADKLPVGKKVNIVGHSMGGLVARYCYEFIWGCSDKIDKIVSGGSPYLGALDAYKLWEGGQIANSDPMGKFAEQLLISLSGRPWILNHDIARNAMPGVRDLLPIVNYLNGLPYSNISFLGKNWTLESFRNDYPGQANLSGKLIAFSGVGQKTPQAFNVTKPGPIDSLIGVWVDGKPTKTNYGDGDGTVLKASSIFGIGDRFYPVSHSDYFNKLFPLTDLLNIFGLPGSPILSALTRPESFRLVYATGDVTISTQNDAGQQIGIIKDGGKSIFIDSSQPVKISVFGQSNTNYEINTVNINAQSDGGTKKINGSIKRGQTIQYSPTP